MVNVSTAIFVYYAVIITAVLIILVDFKIYITTPYAIRKNWPGWKYLPGGAIIAYYKYHKLEQLVKIYVQCLSFFLKFKIKNPR